MTNFLSLNAGDAVNLEADVMAKYIERILTYGKKEERAESITMEKLTKLGYA